MLKYFRNLSLYRKVMILTLCIIFFIIIITGGISLALQTRAMKSNLIDQVAAISSLTSTMINKEELEKTLQSQDKTGPAYKKICDQLNFINQSNSSHIYTYFLLPKLVNNEMTYVVPPKNCELSRFEPFSAEGMPEEFQEGLVKAAYYNQVANSKVYHQFDNDWITVFSPINDSQKNMIGMLAISANASIIGNFHKEILYYFSIIFIIMSIIAYTVFKWGLNKVLEPVNEMMKGINEVSNGNFEVKLPVNEQSDLGQLTERFNYMTEQLSLLFERVTMTSKQLGKESQTLRQSSAFEDAIGEMEHIVQKTKILKELQRAEKMNAIGQLAASVAHEIRNPMTVVKGFLQIFKAKKELSEEEQMFIKLMIEEMDRAETIINDYLSLAKPDMENTERVDAVSLAQRAVDLMNSYAMMAKNIELEIVTDEPVFVNGNRSELKQVLINILKNGIEAMKDGGVIHIRVYRTESFGVFEIKDSGIGMTQEELDRLGTAFYSLKEKGTGMGLMVCYQIIERMKGNIDVVSQKGIGTTFTISVPLDEDERE